MRGTLGLILVNRQEKRDECVGDRSADLASFLANARESSPKGDS
ncbi:MAG: hypothetical protein NVSMB14_01670 [Isosphaeraceae bacterium]